MRYTRALLHLATLLAVMLTCNVAHAIGLLCNISSTPINYGVYSFIQASPNNSSGGITVTCLLSVTVSVSITQGQSGSFTNRYMVNGVNSDKLTYNLFLDNGRTKIFGDGTGGSYNYNALNITLLGGQTVSVYGQIPAKQNVIPGNYSDEISIELGF
jgi:spore coat protein U-like protein